MFADAPAIDHVVNSRGQRIYFDPADVRAQSLKATSGSVNPGSLRLWEHALRHQAWDVVIDVGSNYGEMLVGVELPDGAEVIAFEPNTAVLPYLRRTLGEFDREVTLVPLAVADEPAVAVAFSKDLTWSGKSHLGAERQSNDGGDVLETEYVDVTTLDIEVGDRGFQRMCVKIDVEGHEHNVLSGARELMRTTPHWAIMLETLHMTVRQFLNLAREYNMYVLDLRTDRLVPVVSTNPEIIQRIFDAGWLYTQDALLMGKRGTP